MNKNPVTSAVVLFTHGSTPNSYGHAEVILKSDTFEFCPYKIMLTSQYGSSTNKDFYAIELGVTPKSGDIMTLRNLKEAEKFLKPIMNRLEKLNEISALGQIPRGTTRFMALYITNLLVASKSSKIQIADVGGNWEIPTLEIPKDQYGLSTSIYSLVAERLEKLKSVVDSRW